MKKIAIALLLMASLLQADTFESGTASLGITGGSGSVSYSGTNFGYIENYYILGVNADYFIVDNLSVGFGYRLWFNGSPTIHQATVPVTYYVPTGSKFRPYLGAFYRYTYFDGNVDDYNSAGGRLGLAILFDQGYMGFGWVQEYRLDANNLSDDTSGYPEVTIGFSF